MCESCGCVHCDACGAPLDGGICSTCGEKPDVCTCELLDEELDYEEEEDFDDDEDEEEDEDEEDEDEDEDEEDFDDEEDEDW